MTPISNTFDTSIHTALKKSQATHPHTCVPHIHTQTQLHVFPHTHPSPNKQKSLFQTSCYHLKLETGHYNNINKHITCIIKTKICHIFLGIILRSFFFPMQNGVKNAIGKDNNHNMHTENCMPSAVYFNTAVSSQT